MDRCSFTSVSDNASPVVYCVLVGFLAIYGPVQKNGAVQKEMGSPNYFKFTRELKSAKI